MLKSLFNNKRFIGIAFVVGLVTLGGFLIFTDKESGSEVVEIPVTVPSNEVDWKKIGDRNGDGELDVLDMILYVQSKST